MNMLQLRPGKWQFAPGDFGALTDLRKLATHGRPDVLLIGCCDQGTSLDHISMVSSERTYIVQTLAACIPAPGAVNSPSIKAGLEYAIRGLQVRHVIVCGHLDCGVISRWTRDYLQSSPPPQFAEAIRFVRRTRSALESRRDKLSQQQRHQLLIQQQTLQQLQHLLQYDLVESALRKRQLKLYCWVVDDQTARVHTYHPARQQFHAFSQGS